MSSANRSIAVILILLATSTAAGCFGSSRDSLPPDLSGYVVLGVVPEFLDPSPGYFSFGQDLARIAYGSKDENGPLLILLESQQPIPYKSEPRNPIEWHEAPRAQDVLGDVEIEIEQAGASAVFKCASLTIEATVFWSHPIIGAQDREQLGVLADELNRQCIDFELESIKTRTVES